MASVYLKGNLEHLLVQQRRHGVRHDVVLQGARAHRHRPFAQLLGQLPEGATPPVNLRRHKQTLRGSEEFQSLTEENF